MNIALLVLLAGPARADIAIPEPPPVGTVEADLPPPDAPERRPSDAVLGAASVLGGLVVLGLLGLRSRRLG